MTYHQATKDRIKAIIEQDCAIKNRYINEEGQTCAIGALALAAGVSPDVLRAAESWTVLSGRREVATIRRAISRKFRLTAYDQAYIQSANDSFDTQAERREEVLNRLAGL